MPSSLKKLEQALALHREKQRVESERMYREVLEMDAKNVDALHLLALLCHEEARGREACGLIQRAIEINADSSMIQNAAGVIYAAVDCTDEAIGFFHAAIDLEPKAIESYRNLLPMLTGRKTQLADLCRRGISHGVQIPEIYRELANLQFHDNDASGSLSTWIKMLDENLADEGDILRISEQVNEIESLNRLVLHCRGVLDEDPKRLDAHQILGVILSGRLTAHHQSQLTISQRGEMEAAVIHHWDCALKLSPTARCYDLAGRSILEMGFVERAVGLLEKAIERDPHFAPSFECLAIAKLELGLIQECQQLLLKAVAFGPIMSRAELELAKIDQQPSPKDLDRLQRALRASTLSQGDEVCLRFALAYRLEAMGQQEEAFEALLAANALKTRDICRNVRQEFDASPLVRVFSREFFERCTPAPCTPAPNESVELPVLIVGMPRSGTTLVEQMLGCHSQVFAAGELATVSHLVRSLQQRLHAGTPYPEIARSLDANTVSSMSNAYLDELQRKSQQEESSGNERFSRITDKMPTNHRHLGLVARLLPGVRVIHVTRDLRDVFVSCMKQDLSWPFCDPESLVYYMQQYRRLMRHWEDVLPIRLIEVPYESLVTNPQKEVAEMLRFLDLPWQEACLDFTESRRAVRTPSKGQVRKPIYRTSIGQWKQYEQHFRTIFQELASMDR